MAMTFKNLLKGEAESLAYHFNLDYIELFIYNFFNLNNLKLIYLCTYFIDFHAGICLPSNSMEVPFPYFSFFSSFKKREIF